MTDLVQIEPVDLIVETVFLPELTHNQRYYRRNRERRIMEADAYNRAHRAKRTIIETNSARKRKYGLDKVQWQALFESQSSCCKICKTDKPGVLGGGIPIIATNQKR